MEELAAMCDDVSRGYFHVWELGRQAVGKPGGPDWEEVDDLLHMGFEWHDMAEKVRAKAQ